MNNLIPKSGLHFNIEIEFNNSGKTLNEIFKEHFLLYIKEIKLNRENMKPIKEEIKML